MTSEICVDANLAVIWYVPEPWREQTVGLLDECLTHNIRIIAPDCIFAEAASAIRRKVYRGLLEADEGHVAISLLAGFPIDSVDVRTLYNEAWKIAAAHNLPTLYDAYYLALAMLRKCDFWTADERFYNSISSISGLTCVKYIKDYLPGILEQ
ncbi:MAG: type II toxin-antitoxin system VapC family toxin [Armatimonadetes bacterium]|nr:type II toxin-antitoxin system VapC family toxin [Armatimonadota bacterium]